MHKATCDKCSKKCEVPFKPTGSKPIFCSDCFQGGDRGGRGGGRRFGGDRDRGDRKMYKATCDECGDRCEVPFKPSGDKPIKCDKCFGKGGGRGKGGDFEKQFEMINTKLDKILKVITPTVTVDLDEKKTKKEVKKEENRRRSRRRRLQRNQQLRKRPRKRPRLKRLQPKKPLLKSWLRKLLPRKLPRRSRLADLDNLIFRVSDHNMVADLFSKKGSANRGFV